MKTILATKERKEHKGESFLSPPSLSARALAMEESGSHLSRSLRSFAANNSRSAFTMIEIANVRSLTGSAMEQGGADPTMAFSYQMTVQISPFATSFNTTQQDPHLGVNLYDLRLLFAWPILPNGSIGPYRQTFRTLISAPLIQSTIPGLWYFARQNYTLTNAIYGATNSY